MLITSDLFGYRSDCVSERRIVRRSVLFLAFCLVFASAVGFAQPVEKPLASGVTLIQDINTDPGSPLVINAVKADLKTAGVRAAAALGQGSVIGSDPTQGRERVSSIVKRLGALVGVNADYFPWTGDPLGVMITGGELVSEPMDRAAIGFTASGQVIIDRVSFSGKIKSASGAEWPVRGINRSRGANEMVVYAPIYGKKSGCKDGIEFAIKFDGKIRHGVDISVVVASAPAIACGAEIPKDGALISAHGRAAEWVLKYLRLGDQVTLRFDIAAESGRSWDGVVEAVGGGPFLVRAGQIYIDASQERFKSDMSSTRHPRTAAGVDDQGNLLLVTVDGRQSISQGATLSELARVMKNLGAVDALNLDGGGSTTLSVRGVIVNSPCEGLERPVANALLLYAQSEASQTAPEKFAFAESAPLQIACGQGRMISLIDDGGFPLGEDVAKKLVWGTTGGVGFVNQKGFFTPLRLGKGSIVVMLGERRIELPVIVTAGAPASLDATIQPDPSGDARRVIVVVSVKDSGGNPVAGVSVAITVIGGSADVLSAVTGDDGTARFNVTWDLADKPGQITVKAAGLTSVAK